METFNVRSLVRWVGVAALATEFLCGPCLQTFAAEPPASPTPRTATTPKQATLDPSAQSEPLPDVKLDGGFFSGRMRFGGRTDLPSPPPGAPEPTISRRDFLRIKDMKEEKENWMYLQPGQLQREREKKEDSGGLRSRWDIQDDLRKKTWLDYGTQKGSGELSGPSGEPRTQAQYEAEMRERQLFEQKQGAHRYDGSLSRPLAGTGKTTLGGETSGAHQAGELNLRDLVGGAPSKYDENTDLSFKDVFGGEYVNLKDRETAQNKRTEFQNFLNQSRVPVRPASELGGGTKDLNQGLQHSFGSFGRNVGRDGGGDSSAMQGSGGGSLGGSFDSSPSANFSGASRSTPLPYQAFDPNKSYITPAMMQPPKRRF